MLMRNPDARISACEARQHPYFNYDSLDKEIIRNGLIAYKNFGKYGKIQKCFLKFYVDKLQPSK